MAAPRNLVNLKDVVKGYGSRSVLRDITLGVAAGDRIGVVGANGDGKSTLLRARSPGAETPDEGAITRAGDLHLALLGQRDELDDARTIREELVGGRADHEWAADSRFRSVLDGLLGGVDLRRFPARHRHPDRAAVGRRAAPHRARQAPARLRPSCCCSTSRRTTSTSRASRGSPATSPRAAARCSSSPTIAGSSMPSARTRGRSPTSAIHQYEGGYAAYVLARAERDRQEAARNDRRQQLLRKELAWLRRGPPARTAKPKFRIEAANALIAAEPEPRDRAELLRFATSRLGDKVLEAIDATVAFGDQAGAARRDVAPRARATASRSSASTARARRRCWRCSAASSSRPSGTVERGATVRLAHLSQDTAEIPGHLDVLESLEAVKSVATLSGGLQITAALLCDRFGFRGDKARTLVRDLSGGERRRLQLMRLLMGEPNVLLLDEPTNDLDIDTLTALEDLLDALAGHARRRQPRPLLRRARLRRRPRADAATASCATSRAGSSSTSSRAARARAGAGGAGRIAANGRRPRRRQAGAAPARSCAPRARRSPAWSARSTSSPRARRRCTTQMAAAATDHERLRELQAELHGARRRARAARSRRGWRRRGAWRRLSRRATRRRRGERGRRGTSCGRRCSCAARRA